ncbi:unnamed protein product, partial [Rotaria magnacalcarata]
MANNDKANIFRGQRTVSGFAPSSNKEEQAK